MYGGSSGRLVPVDHGREVARVRVEVRRLLQRGAQVQGDPGRLEERARPRTGCDDRDRGSDRAVPRRHLDTVAGGRDRLDPGLLAQLGSVTHGQRGQHLDGLPGAQDGAVGLVDEARARREPQHRPSLGDLGVRGPFEPLAGLLERGRGRLGRLADVQPTHHPQQLLTGLVLQLPPPLQREPRHPDVQGIVVREPEVAGRPRGASLVVPEREPLEQDHRTAARAERSGRRRSHRPASHDHDVEALHRGGSVPGSGNGTWAGRDSEA